MAVARTLAEGPPPSRPVLFIAFSGEERGLLGSGHYVREPTVPLDDATAMLNMDMVGRLRENRLTVFGLGTAPEWEGILQGANASMDEPLSLTLAPDGYGPSDHSSFYGIGIPVLHFFTNTHSEYHRPEDDVETINGPGLERVATLVGRVTAEVAGVGSASTAAPELSLVETEPPQPSESGGRGYGPYFGSIPDMGSQEYGVRLTGVREGSPADAAGLRGGDVIVGFGGDEVGDLYAYTYALRARKPGDAVDVIVMRDGQRLSLQAVLGERR
jgi:membrane-associated protease RseP (regulator of RpoE activity)